MSKQSVHNFTSVSIILLNKSLFSSGSWYVSLLLRRIYEKVFESPFIVLFFVSLLLRRIYEKVFESPFVVLIWFNWFGSYSKVIDLFLGKSFIFYSKVIDLFVFSILGKKFFLY